MTRPGAMQEGMLLFLHDLFRAPGAKQWEFLTSEETRATWSALAPALGLPAEMGLPSAAAEYEAAYIETFDAGLPHPPVPLVESHYNKRDPLPKVLHENILYHHAFGLNLLASSDQTSDHLLHQLEFVAYLFRLEQTGCAERSSSDVERTDTDGRREDRAEHAERIEQIGRAREDFIGRHLLSWIPLASKAAAASPHLWVQEYFGALDGVIGWLAESPRIAPPAEPDRATAGGRGESS